MMKNYWNYISVPLYSVAVLLLGAYITAGVFLIHVAVVPLVFKYSKTFQRTLIFANFVKWPLYTDFEEPSASGIDGARNLSIEFQSKVDKRPVKIGIWHILPKTIYEKLKGSFEGTVDKEQLNRLLDEELANSRTPIIVYFHGNSNSRAASHRIRLYKFFQKMDFHTIAFDYRGYGDSSNIHPSEDGVVEDALVVYEWLHNIVQRNGQKPDIFVWGHSLGTGISSHMLGNLEELSKQRLESSMSLPMPKGLILEAPFSNIADEVANHPLTVLVKWLPYFDTTFVSPFRTAPNHTFRSDVYLCNAPTLPVLILHAKDDAVVPYSVGLKLYKSVMESRSKGGAMIKIHAYDEDLNLGHKWIVDAPDLHEVIGNFTKGNM